MSDMTFHYTGRCACGALSLVYSCAEDIAQQTARACQCEFCAPRSAVYLSNSQAALEVTVRDRRWLYAHRFGTTTADFMHCARCNTLCYVQSVIDGQRYGLVCLDVLETPSTPAAIEAVDFEGESLGGRLQRRAGNWIPRVKIVEGDESRP